MSEIRFPALPQCEPLCGTEKIALGEKTLATVQDFWRWAYSNINDNASRGRFAEYIVCAALDCAEGTRAEWEPYDILWDGIKIEVKSSAYIQAWAQKKLSRLAFRIQPTHFWDSESSTEDSVARRQADVYVFCIENCMEQSEGNPNPLDLTQWEFRVLSTKILDTLGEQKTISLAQLDQLDAIVIKDAFNLPEAIKQVAAEIKVGAADD